MSTSSGIVPLGDVREDIDRAARRLRTATVRAGSIGAALKGGLNLFGVLARARRRPRRGGSLRLDAADALRDTAAFAAFLGTFGCVYVAVDEGVALGVGKQRSREWRAAVAGAIAAPSLLLADPRPASRSRPREARDARNAARHNGLATYLALRACVLLTRSALKRREKRTLSPVPHALLAPFASPHADVGLMCLSATVILSCFILRRDAVVGPYAKFLDRHGGKPVARYAFAGALAKATTARDTRNVIENAAAALYETHGAKKDDARHAALLRSALNVSDASLMRARPRLWRLLVHPETTSGGAHFFFFFLNSLGRSFGVNAPLYLVSTLVVHRFRVLDKRAGPAILKRSLVGTARSSAFLSAYCALAWAGPDAAQTLLGRVRWWTVSLGVPLAGLATFLEKPSRRQELGVYCGSRALEAVAVLLASGGRGTSVGRRRASRASSVKKKAVETRVQRAFLVSRFSRAARFDVATFALASAAVMRCYANERDVFRSKYLNVLDYVFGNQGHGRQRVRHVGSAYQLMTEPPEMPASPKKKKGDDEKKER